jgi:hypothetical protein
MMSRPPAWFALLLAPVPPLMRRPLVPFEASCALGPDLDGLSGLLLCCCGGSCRALLAAGSCCALQAYCADVYLAGTRWCMRRGCSQMFKSAAWFNANLASWNVLRVATLTSAFDSTALADCYKKDMYTAWGTTLQKAYPAWSTSLCTPRCAVADPRPDPVAHAEVRATSHRIASCAWSLRSHNQE